MDLANVAAFAVVTALLISAPGPDWAFVVRSSVQSNAVAPAVGGLVVGYSVVTLVVAGGVGTLIATSSVALSVVTLAGGTYLMWLGASALWRSPARSVESEAPGGSGRAVFFMGMGVSVMNPKGLLIFVAILPQFTNAAGWPYAGQMAVLGAIFTLQCGLFYSALGSLARRLTVDRPRLTDVLGRVSALGLLIVGGFLVVEHLAR